MTSINSIPSLRIGDLEINYPIIQGGMGVRVSRSGLAAAVANEGAAGIIASVGLGDYQNCTSPNPIEDNRQALVDEIRQLRSMTDGVIGVNVMAALSDYEWLARKSAAENIDMIISGAGLPLKLPEYVPNPDIKLLPVVSSARSLALICKRWKKAYNRLPDAVVVEGPLAGGHLGYTMEKLENNSLDLRQILKEVLDYTCQFNPPIPVIAAGGIFDGSDIRKFLDIGASGVQMATRFVCTCECDVHENFKKAYVQAKTQDTVLIKSPVGLPGRVIKNKFVESILTGKVIPFNCKYQCLKTCDPNTAPYCIAEVLADAAMGRMDRSFAFAGSNVGRCDEIITVKALFSRIRKEYLESAHK